ncbi:MAG: TraR/DksA family transcriptional regulator [Calditrichota bacterium]
MTARQSSKAKADKVAPPPEPGKWPTGTKPAVYSPEWKEYFRDIILKKRQEILKELSYLRESSMEATTDQYSGDNSTYSYHMADQGTDAQEREKAFLFASREGKMLRLLDSALERIENGTYGYCQETNEPIEFRRLEAIPHARLCIAAKKKNEEENSTGE